MSEKNPYRISWELDEENNVAVATVRKYNPESEEYEDFDSRSFALDSVRQLQDKIALYGLSKVLQDRSSSTPSGPEKLDTMENVFGKLQQGEWRAAREGGGGGGGISPEVEAVAEIKDISIAQAQKALKAMSKEDRAKVKENPKVKEVADRIREERKAQGGVELDDLVS